MFCGKTISMTQPPNPSPLRSSTSHLAIGYEQSLPVTDPHCFVAREVAGESLGPHDLLVEVAAVSVNPVDTKQRAAEPEGGFRVLGFDAAGTVRQVGEAVTLFAAGDEVFYAGALNRPGSNQQFHAVDERIVGHKPTTLDFAAAASLPLTALTAWEALFDKLRLSPSSEGTLLVVGATGGVGSIMLQLAEALLPRVRVIATASDPERAAWVLKLGAEATVNHREDLAAQVQQLAPQGIDWVFTAHSSGQFPVYAELLRPFGHIVAVEGSGDGITSLKSKSISLHWEFMFSRSLYQSDDMIEQHHILNRIAQLVDEGKVQATAQQFFSPISAETLRQAHALIESGTTLGKVVLHGWD